MQDEVQVPEIELVIATNNGLRTVRAGDMIPRDFKIMDVRWHLPPAYAATGPGMIGASIMPRQQPASVGNRAVEVRGLPLGLVLTFVGAGLLLDARFGPLSLVALGIGLALWRTVARNTQRELEARRARQAP
jgi:hypothetical protein